MARFNRTCPIRTGSAATSAAQSGRPRYERPLGAEESLQHRRVGGDDGGEVASHGRREGRVRPEAGEVEQIPGHLGRLPGRGADEFGHVPSRVGGVHLFEEPLDPAPDDRQQVVEVVRDGGDLSAHRGESVEVNVVWYRVTRRRGRFGHDGHGPSRHSDGAGRERDPAPRPGRRERNPDEPAVAAAADGIEVVDGPAEPRLGRQPFVFDVLVVGEKRRGLTDRFLGGPAEQVFRGRVPRPYQAVRVEADERVVNESRDGPEDVALGGAVFDGRGPDRLRYRAATRPGDVGRGRVGTRRFRDVFPHDVGPGFGPGRQPGECEEGRFEPPGMVLLPAQPVREVR